MKKLILSILGILCLCTLFSVQLFAYPHGYKRKTEDIYATVRQDITVYADDNWDEAIDYLPPFTGIRVIYVGDYWREIEYTRNGETRIGWVSEDEFYSCCLYYDGRDKQILADGDYTFTHRGNEPLMTQSLKDSSTEKKTWSKDISLKLTLTYIGDNAYHIRQTDTGRYLQADTPTSKDHVAHWGNFRKAGSFIIERTENKYWIRDKDTGYVIYQDDCGLLIFINGAPTGFTVKRLTGKVLEPDNLRVFAQYDADWAGDYYGSGTNDDPTSNNFCTSACGIFAPLNAIYTLTGKFIDPHKLADYAVKEYFRIQGNGTDSGFFRAASRKFGRNLGFKSDGEGDSIGTLKRKLRKGDVAIAHVPGHYVAIVDYDETTKKFLLLDSHYLPKRKTNPYGDWVSAKDLEGDTNLYASMYHFYKLRQ